MLTVAAGEPFEVELGSAPSTGYMWELTDPPEGLTVLGRDFRQAPNAAIGDGGTQIFRLQADVAGYHGLRFELKRRWETESVRTQVIEVRAE